MTNPFAERSSSRRAPLAHPRDVFIPPTLTPKIQPRQLPKEPPKRVNPPYYLSSVSKKEIEQELDKGTITAEGLPTIYRLGTIFAALNRRAAPTLTDIQTAILFRSPERLERIASGQEELKTVKFDLEGKPIMDPRRFGEYWKKVAVQALEKWREPETPASS